MPLRLATFVLALSILPAVAQAEDGWSGEGVLATEFISKGAGKSNGEPVVQGRLEYATGAVYLGIWGSPAYTSQGGDAEFHAYIGVEGEAGPFDLDGRIMAKTIPGTMGGVQDDWVELRGSASTTVGGTKVSLKIEYSPDNYAAAEQAWWVEGTVSRKLTERVTGSLGYGVREQDNGTDYSAWNAGATVKLTKSLGLDLRWYGTNRDDLGDNYEDRIVGSLTLAF